MPASSGVTTKKNKKGEIIGVTINIRKHPQALPALKKLGILLKSQFDIDFENGITLNELENHLLNIVNKHFAGKR